MRRLWANRSSELMTWTGSNGPNHAGIRKLHSAAFNIGIQSTRAQRQDCAGIDEEKLAAAVDYRDQRAVRAGRRLERGLPANQEGARLRQLCLHSTGGRVELADKRPENLSMEVRANPAPTR